jgi:type VI secretion system protein ImpF
MAELTPKERLQPSLLDRLTDHDPSARQESRDRRVLSTQQLRNAVLRDLAWLLNTDNLHEDLEAHPLVASSVLNFGMRDLTGATASSLDAKQLRARLIQAIKDFEPRIDAKSLKVKVLLSDESYNRNSISFEIKAQLWAEPVPLDLLLKTEIDLERGDVKVEEVAG